VRRFEVLAFIVLGVATATPAHAAPASQQPVTSQQADCGKTAADALNAARAALAVKDTSHDREALACLIAAVSALNAGDLNAVRDPDMAQHMLAVPHNPGTTR
jgi:hypothetical protein